MLKFIKACALDQENDRDLSFTGRVFPRPFTHWGGTSAGGESINGGTSAGGQSINGGTHGGDIDLMGG